MPCTHVCFVAAAAVLQCKDRVDDVLDKIMDVMKVCGCSLISDGWSNAQNRPLLNFLVTTPKGTKFLSAIDTSGAVKDAPYIAAQLALAITQQGAEDIVCICTDSAGVNAAAAALLKEEFPGIAWVRCGAHGVDLALTSIGKLPWVKDILDQASTLVKFVTNHHASLALVRKHAAEGSKKSLQKPGA